MVDLLNTFIMKLYECRMLSEAKKRTHSKWFKNKHLKNVRSYLEEGLDFKFLFSFGWFSLTFWMKYGCTSLIFLNMKSEGRKKRKKHTYLSGLIVIVKENPYVTQQTSLNSPWLELFQMNSPKPVGGENDIIIVPLTNQLLSVAEWKI